MYYFRSQTLVLYKSAIIVKKDQKSNQNITQWAKLGKMVQKIMQDIQIIAHLSQCLKSMFFEKKFFALH